MNEKEESKFIVYIRKFRKLWKDKRYRSLIILILYFLFFLTIFLFLGSVKNDKTYITNNEYIFSKYDIYEFNTEININDTKLDIIGKRYKDKYEFEYNGELIKLDYNNLILDNSFDKNIINALSYDPILISNIIDNSELVSEKNIISEKILIKEYSINLEKYLKILDINLINYDINDNIIITTSEKDKQIIQTSLDLTNLYKYFEESYQKYQITINYNNLNNIEEF